MTEQTKTSHMLKSFLRTVFVILTAVGVIIAIMLGVNELIDRRIENEQFIRKVAAHIRPYVIFDVGETVHVDGGAMEYLEKIAVEITGQTWKNAKPEEKYDYQLKIAVTPKSYLAHAPLIEPLSGLRSIIVYDGERDAGYQWTYQVLIRPPYGGEIKTQKFRLEVLR